MYYSYNIVIKVLCNIINIKKVGDILFGKFVKGIGIITTISLLHTSISDASESPVTIANKEKNSSISNEISA